MVTAPRTNGSVVKQPDGSSGMFGEYILRYQVAAEDIVPWGGGIAQRDRQLREFWHTEPILASSVYTTSARYAAFGWHLEGPDRTVAQVERMLHGVEFGAGWEALIIKVLIDLFTQDNGAFIEVIRSGDSPSAAVVSLKHLDAARCVRTGVAETPVDYFDIDGKGHRMKWYQVIPLTEFPSPVEFWRGIQYCAVTRLLRAAQTMKDISIYNREKVSGRFHRAIYLVSGVQDRTIRSAIDEHRSAADAQGLMRYTQPLVIGAVDPTANLKVEQIELASMPDAFDPEVFMRWYVNQLALAFGQDYQDLAPLPGGNLGSAQQSTIGHLKGRGKGPRLFMNTLGHKMNYHGVMPSNVHFDFGDIDVAEDADKVNLQMARAKERQIRIQAGELTPQMAVRIAVIDGDLDKDLAEELLRQIEEREKAKAEQEERKLAATEQKLTTRNLPATKEPQPERGGRPRSNGQVTR